MTTPQQKRSAARKREERKAKEAALLRDRYCCKYCGRSIEYVPLAVHHVIYKSQGGSNELSNLITLCQDSGCHAHNRAHGKDNLPLLHIEWNGDEFVFTGEDDDQRKVDTRS